MDKMKKLISKNDEKNQASVDGDAKKIVVSIDGIKIRLGKECRMPKCAQNTNFAWILKKKTGGFICKNERKWTKSDFLLVKNRGSRKKK
jgi:hypothetical protein